ncbi:MAG: hypothetical protein FWG35_02895 [Spirochaetaceae bacterium]|nr:hypothetical protein [Spirochaetaceae bacterium]
MVRKIAAIIFLVFFSACSGSAPSITEIRYRLTTFHDREKNQTGEYLSVAVLAFDEDGHDDIETLSVIHDESELYWQSSRDSWKVHPARQQPWIVVEKILAPQEAIPRGRYRVIVRDYAGSQAESSFTVTAPSAPVASFPRLEQPAEGGGLVLAGSRGEAVLMVQSAAGALLGSFVLKEGSNPRAAILANEQIRSQARDLYLWEEGGSQALLSGPWPAEDYLFNTGIRE